MPSQAQRQLKSERKLRTWLTTWLTIGLTIGQLPRALDLHAPTHQLYLPLGQVQPESNATNGPIAVEQSSLHIGRHATARVTNRKVQAHGRCRLVGMPWS